MCVFQWFIVYSPPDLEFHDGKNQVSLGVIPFWGPTTQPNTQEARGKCAK